MKTLLKQIYWQFLILNKNKLIAISLLVTAIYAVIFYLIKDLPNTDRFLTLLIFSDPAIIGLFFIGVGVIMEKNDAVLNALFVTPSSYHVYLISRVLALSVIGWGCAAGMTLALLGPDVNWLNFSSGIFATCMIFCFAGFFVVSFTMDFLNFILRSIPVMVFLSLPLFNYFELTNIAAFEFTPVQGPLDLLISSFQTNSNFVSISTAYISTLAWIPILYFGVYRVFVHRIVKGN
jgi:fluoroquinolone transport system permease protein